MIARYRLRRGWLCSLSSGSNIIGPAGYPAMVGFLGPEEGAWTYVLREEASSLPAQVLA